MECPFENALNDEGFLIYRIIHSSSGTVSIVSSSLIIFMIFSGGRQQIAKVHNRLLMMISIFDIIYSLAFIAGPHPMPKGTLCARGAIGNELTCSIQGYAITLGAGIPSGYTATLCLYYVAVIRYNAQEATIKKFEPLMHLVSLLPGFTIATVFLISGDYHSFVGVCAISEKCRYDPDCWEESREVDFSLLSKMFSLGLYLALVFATITTSMIFIYCTVRERQTTMNRYNFGSLRDARGRARSGMRRLTNRVTNTAVQASLYIVSFFVSYMTTAVMVFLIQMEVAGLSPVLVYIFATLQPLQGFWNLVIFIRPKYLDARLRMRDESVMSVLKVVIFRRQQPLLRDGIGIGRSSRPLVREGTTTREIIRQINPVIQKADITEEKNKARHDCGDAPQESQQYRSLHCQTSFSHRRASWHSSEYLDGSVASSLSLLQQPLWEGREGDEESSISDGVDNNEGESARTTPTSKSRGSFFSLQKSESTVSSISEIIAGDNDLPSRSQRKRRSSLPNLYSSQNCSEVGTLSLTSSHSAYQNSTLSGCLDNAWESGEGGDIETTSPPKKVRQTRKRRKRRSSLPSLHQHRRSSLPSLHQHRRSSLPTVPGKNTPKDDIVLTVFSL